MNRIAKLLINGQHPSPRQCYQIDNRSQGEGNAGLTWNNRPEVKEKGMWGRPGTIGLTSVLVCGPSILARSRDSGGSAIRRYSGEVGAFRQD
jgi:hypothetical protein